MRIDLKRLEKAGWVVDVSTEHGIVDIYPNKPNHELGVAIIKNLEFNTELPLREIEILTDTFMGEIQKAQLFKLID